MWRYVTKRAGSVLVGVTITAVVLNFQFVQVTSGIGHVGVLINPEDIGASVHRSLIAALESNNLTHHDIPNGGRSSANSFRGVCQLLSQGILGLFSTSVSPLLSSTASIFDIPYCTTVKWEGGPPNGFTTGLTRNHWRKLLRDLMAHFDSTAVALLHEDREGLSQLQTLLEQPSPVGRVFVQTLENPLGTLRLVRDRVRTIIIHCSLELVKEILRIAVQLDMRDHHYIFTNLDFQRLDLSEFSNVNFTAFQLVSPNYLTKEGLVLDCVEAFARGLASLPSQLHAENLSCDAGPRPWSQGLTLINYISSVDFTGKTGRVTFREGERGSLSLQLLRYGGSGLVGVGQWSFYRGLNITQRFYDETIRRNVTLVVTTVLETPYVMLLPNQTGNAQFEGFSVDLLKLLSNHIGFKYVLEYDTKYGAYDTEGGEWNGVVKKLIERKADLAIGSMTINHARESVIDFTKPFMHLGISILFKVPTRPPAKLYSFLNPLAIEIWLLILFAYFCVSLTMFFVSRFSPHSEAEHFGLANAFWYPIGTLMQQGSDLNPRKTSTRLVAGFWWFFSLVIISSYTANLAAFLTVERMSTPIESAEDLAGQSEIAYGTLDSGSTMAFFRDSKMETFQRMWRSMESRSPSVFVSTYEEGIRRVLDGNYAFLMESSVIEYIVKQNCNLTQIGGLLDSKSYGIATPIGSPWRDKISLAILEMTEKGIIQRLMTRWWQNTATAGCSSDDSRKKKEASALGVDSIGGVFVVLTVGLSVAVVVAIFEFCVHAQRSSTSICSEMAREARFAVRCRGKRRPALHRHCASCSNGKEETPRRAAFHDYNTYPHTHEHRQLNGNNGGILPPIYTHPLCSQSGSCYEG